MTVPTLVRRLAVRLDVPTYRAGFILRAVVVATREALAAGDSITLKGLGTLRVKPCGSRVVEDFRGTPHVTRGRKISFHPSKSLRDILS